MLLAVIWNYITMHRHMIMKCYIICVVDSTIKIITLGQEVIG